MHSLGNPRDAIEQNLYQQNDFGSMLPGRQQALASPESRQTSLQSLCNVSQYVPEYPDRQPRLYHYRPPYVEDDLVDEEYYLRQQDLNTEHMGINLENHYGPYFGDEHPSYFQRPLPREQ